jgi:hypothetical protein
MKKRYLALGAAAALLFFAGCANPSGGGEQGEEQSGDASLKSLAFYGAGGAELDLSYSFDQGKDAYVVAVANGVAALTVAGTPEHDKAAAGGDSGVERTLSVGPNTFTITITAENGTAQDYLVIVTRDTSAEARAAADAFKTAHAAVLALNPEGVTVADAAGVNGAITAHDALSAEARMLLAGEKEKLDALKAKIDALSAGAEDSAAAAAFRAAHGTALALTVEGVTVDDEAAVDGAIAAYNALSAGAKALTAGEKSLLDKLRAKITAIKTEGLAGQADKDAAAAFRADHAPVLSLTPEAAAVSDEAAVNRALSDYNGKNAVVKNLLGVEKSLLEELSARIAALQAAAESQAAANAFRNGNAEALALSVETVVVDNERAVNSAIAAWNGLAPGARDMLAAEKEKLDALKTKIEELKTAAANQAGADSFKTSHGTALALTADTVSPANETMVNNALAAYEVLAQAVKDLLAGEKEKLDALKTKIEELKTAAANQAGADSFKASHRAALALTADTVGPANETMVNNALAAYEVLAQAVKDLLTAEKEKLDALKDEIPRKTEAAVQAAAEAFKTDHPVVSKTVDTVNSGDEAAVNAAIAVYDALSGAVQEKLLPLSREGLEALQTKIGELKIAEANQAGADGFKTSHAAALALTTATVSPANETIINNALAAYGILAQAVKDLLAAEKEKLDALKAEIGRQRTAAAAEFTSAHGAILAKTVDNLTGGDAAAVDAAWAAYNALSEEVRALLPEGTGTRLGALKSRAEELNAPAAVAAYRTAHGTFLDTDPANLTLADAASLNAARTGYNALSAPARALAAAEYAKLQALEARMAALGAEQVFRSNHAAALALTTVAAGPAHEPIVNNALAAYDGLSADAKALLTAEKALLDSLKTAIRLLKTGTALIGIAYGQMEDADFNFSPISLDQGSPAAARQAAFALEAGCTAIRWSVDAAEIAWADDELIFIFDAADWSVGDHLLGVTAARDGRSWSKNIVITVSDDTL